MKANLYIEQGTALLASLETSFTKIWNDDLCEAQALLWADRNGFEIIEIIRGSST